MHSAGRSFDGSSSCSRSPSRHSRGELRGVRRERAARQWDPRTVAVNRETGEHVPAAAGADRRRPGRRGRRAAGADGLAGSASSARSASRSSRARRRTTIPPARCSTRSRACARPPPIARRARRGWRPTTCSSARPRRGRDQLLRRAARPGRPGLDRAPGHAARGAAAAHDDPGDGAASGSPCSTPACSTTSGCAASSARPTAPTSGTSSTTATATPRPATAPSSPA